MENTKMSEKTQFGNNPGAGEKAPIDLYAKGLSQLRENVKRHISNIKDLLITNTDINTYATVMDLIEKIEYLLYCNSYCKFEKSLLWAYDFAEDIRRVSGIKNYTKIYTESFEMAEEIRKFYFK